MRYRAPLRAAQRGEDRYLGRKGEAMTLHTSAEHMHRDNVTRRWGRLHPKASRNTAHFANGISPGQCASLPCLPLSLWYSRQEGRSFDLATVPPHFHRLLGTPELLHLSSPYFHMVGRWLSYARSETMASLPQPLDLVTSGIQATREVAFLPVTGL